MARPLGATEENWTKATAMGTGIQVVGLAMKRKIETNQVTEAAKAVMQQNAALRSKIVSSKGRLVYETAETPAAEVEVFSWPGSIVKRTATLIHPGDSGELSSALHHVVTEELNTPFPNAAQKFNGPTDVFQIHVYADSSESRTIIVLRLVSGAVDRPGAVIVTQCFLSSLNSLVNGKQLSLPEAPGKNELLPALEDLIPKGKKKGFFQKGLDTVGYVASVGKYVLYPFHSGFSGAKISDYKSDILSYTLGKEGTSALMAACEREKTTVSGALTAAFLKGAASAEDLKSKKQHFSFTTVVDLRPHFEPALPSSALGNYSGGVSQDEQVKAEADFWELARSVSSGTLKEVEKGRHFSEIAVMNMLFSQVLQRPSLTAKSSLRTGLMSIFEKTLDARWKDTQNLELVGTLGPFASMHGAGPCLCIGEGLLEGPELAFSVVYPTPVYSRDQMDGLANTSLAILKTATK
ncbi:hypothetical protein R1sor_000354 [Riccia sorocarpa]|uniref:Phthiocerol/phthiodiolone dimycocerosyl transferase C-terminal domain-containing protein n=1 Tax=Riccia sorocarpa TaxID=122646 RepID=A0ABD3GV90_9MARC